MKLGPMPILCVLAFVLLAGCTQSRWTKPGASAADLDYDQTTCDQLARQRNHDYESRPGGIVKSEFTDQCMEYFGWSRVPSK